jgi:hypothetical protein
MKKPAQILIAYARQQRKAFKAFGLWDKQKEKAAQRILEVSQFFLRSEKTGWIHQIRQEVLELLPAEENEPKKELREKILILINN